MVNDLNKQELAVTYKHQGNNCCQAVLLAFAEELNLSEEFLQRLGAGFGAGMGNMEGTCGALCGAEMLLGLKNSRNVRPRQIHQEFTQKCGASVCKDLKGVTTGKMICSCDDCVRNAVEIAEKYIFS
ncbi:MAG: C_GCAxxG_C_C family protein [Oscillospiraceae bacterium]|nr:C_GCAxxG_C_C family protein [Oscillospiraceae bacterium]MBR7084993.1 C_GCAxxG_C_C family protein [Oscillospiraceae bacterium]